MSADAHDIQREVKKYYAVFTALLVLSVITVAISRLDLTTGRAIALGLAVATVKASLVACFFMHLISEKRFIYGVLVITVVFFVTVLLLPVGTGHDPIYGTAETFLESPQVTEDVHATPAGHTASPEEAHGGH